MINTIILKNDQEIFDKECATNLCIGAMVGIEVPQLRFIYVILNYKNLVAKIGMTKNLERRFTQLQTANVDSLELGAYFIGYKEDEKKLHKLLKSKRIRGEWFRLDTELMNTVNQYMRERNK